VAGRHAPLARSRSLSLSLCQAQHSTAQHSNRRSGRTLWCVRSSGRSAGDVEGGPGFVLVQAVVLLQCPFGSSAIKWGRRTAGLSFFLYTRAQMTLTSTVSCMDTRCSQRAFLLPRHRLGDSTALSLAAVPQCPSQIRPSSSPDATPAYLCYRSCIEQPAYRCRHARCIPPRLLSHWSPYHALECLIACELHLSGALVRRPQRLNGHLPLPSCNARRTPPALHPFLHNSSSHTK
jgi:hypothetical protein